MRVLAVTNIHPTPSAPTLGTFVEQQIKGLRAIGVSVRMLFVDRVGKGMATYLAVPRQVRTAIAAYQPDVVHVMYGGIMAAQITRAVQEHPVVVTFHGSDLLGEHLSGRLRAIAAGVGVAASRRAARQAKRIVVVSRALQSALPENVDRAKVSIIPCGIDLERFRALDRDACRRALGWDDRTLHVLFPANGGNPVKRPALAEAAIAAVRRLGVPATLHYLRGVDYADVPQWLNASDLLLMTSLHEGSPTVVKEALACGVPVVSVDVGDVAEQIEDIDGCFLAHADADHLAAQVVKVRARRRVDGRARMMNYSLDRIARRLVHIYQDVAPTA